MPFIRNDDWAKPFLNIVRAQKYVYEFMRDIGSIGAIWCFVLRPLWSFFSKPVKTSNGYKKFCEILEILDNKQTDHVKKLVSVQELFRSINQENLPYQEFPAEILHILAENDASKQCQKVIEKFFELFSKKIRTDLSDIRKHLKNGSDNDILAPWSNQACERSVFC